MVRTKRLVSWIFVHVVLIATDSNSRMFARRYWPCIGLFWCNFWCMFVQQQVTSYRPCPIIVKWSCMQMALNSYRLMCVAWWVKDFSLEFLHQTLAKTFGIWLLCEYHRNLVVIFHCNMSPRSFHYEKASKSKVFMEKLHCAMSTHGLIC